jgi:glycosyltransferase involved in cell wall biosynthesis
MTDSSTKTVLMVAFHFPPVGGIGAAGSQRALKFVRNLPSEQWRTVVLTLRESSYETYFRMDRTLLDSVPSSTSIVRTRVLQILAPLLRFKAFLSRKPGNLPSDAAEAPPEAPPEAPQVAETELEGGRYQRIKDSVTDLFEIPDEAAGWMLPAIFAGARAVRKHKVDIIIATGRPWTSLVVGAALRKLTRRPLVVDFRDPWMTNPFRPPHSAVKDWAEKVLENWVVKSADLVIANTHPLRSEFIERFGQSLESRCITVLNGFDAQEFSGISPAPRDVFSEGAFLLVHSGFLYGKRDPRNFIDAFAKLRDERIIDMDKVRCDLIGQVELPYDLASYIRERRLDQQIRLSGQISYAESLARLAGCDLGLIVQPGTGTQIPSKIFEYIGFGKKILAVAPNDSAVSAIVSDFGLGEIADADSVDQIANAIAQAYENWSADKESYCLDSATRDQFEIKKGLSTLSSEMQELVS